MEKVNGLPVPYFITQTNVDSLQSFPLRPDDVWIVTYPKSGTTWMQQIVKLIRDDKNDLGKIINYSIPWIEEEGYLPVRERRADTLDLDALPFPRAFKSHFSYESMPCGAPGSTPGKYIYVARNPRDVAVSAFHHTRNIKSDNSIEWNDYIRWFIAGDVWFGNWFDHVLSFWAHKDDDNILFLKYEDMKKDLPTAVAAVAKFMGYDLTQDVIEDIVSQADFDSMQRNPLANYQWSPKIKASSVPFMRKGVVGDWKNYFTPEQSAQFDAIYAERMKGTGLHFEFERICT